MSINRKILFIGGINLNAPPRGGEDFKNQLIHAFLKERVKLIAIDTHNWRRRPWILVEILLRLIINKEYKIWISVTTQSAYRLLKFFHFVPGAKSRTTYFAVGGSFPSLIQKGVLKKSYYEGLGRIVVEGFMMKKILTNENLTSKVTVIPNFKVIPKVLPKKEKTKVEDHFRFVFMSSIIEAKGVPMILKCAEHLLKDPKYKDRFSVDFFGPFESEYEHVFRQVLVDLPSVVSYKGYLNIMGNPAKAYAQLSAYDVFLFPSTYPNEGFPGVLIDAFICGLPVLASDWNLNKEIIEDRKTGFIIDPNNLSAWVDAMKWMIDHPGKVEEMSRNCQRKAREFDIQFLMNQHFENLLC